LEASYSHRILDAWIMNLSNSVGETDPEIGGCSMEDYPYDEAPVLKPVLKKNNHVYFQTTESMRSLSNRSCLRRREDENGTSKAKEEGKVSDIGTAPPPRTSATCGLLVDWARNTTCPAAPTHPWGLSTAERDSESHSRKAPMEGIRGMATLTSRTSWMYAGKFSTPPVTTIGNPDLKVYVTSLPESLLPLLPIIINRCEQHVAHTRGGNWKTQLYSLTQQDLPVAEIPGGIGLTKVLTEFVVQTIQTLYDGSQYSADDRQQQPTKTATAAIPRRPPTVHLDGNQPHVLKYCRQHTGVTLHYDRCDVTAQLMLSASTDYEGGGTHFPSADSTVRLERGQLLLHHGKLVHAGQDITRGTRYLMVWFCHLQYY
jgi:hypothetical protein